MVQDFEAAIYFISNYKPETGQHFPLTNDIRLSFYGLYKQATEGTCRSAAPSRFDIVASKKHEAWMKHANKTAEQAQQDYVALLTSLKADWRDWTEVKAKFPTLGASPVPGASPSTVAGNGSIRQDIDDTKVQQRHNQEHIQHITDAISEAVSDVSANGREAHTQAKTPSAAVPKPAASIYADFTSHSSRTTTPAAAPESLLRRVLTPAQNIVSTLFSGSASGASSALVSPANFSAFTTSPGNISSVRVDPERTGIRWSYSPNGLQNPPSTGASFLSSGGGFESEEEARAVRYTASALAEKSTHEDLARMCAELQMQVAHQRVQLQYAQQALQFYSASLHALPQPDVWAAARQPSDVWLDALLALQRLIGSFYVHLKANGKSYLWAAVMLVIVILLRRRYLRR